MDPSKKELKGALGKRAIVYYRSVAGAGRTFDGCWKAALSMMGRFEGGGGRPMDSCLFIGPDSNKKILVHPLFICDAPDGAGVQPPAS